MQEKQNKLYDFAHEGEGEKLSFVQAEKLRDEMLEQNFSLLEEGAEKGEFLLSSEAVNFPGSPRALDFPAWDMVAKGYDVLTGKLFDFAARKKVWLAIGLYRPLPGGFLRNSLLVIDRQGKPVLTYDKIHLTAGEKNSLSPGDAFCCFDSEFGRIGLCICWDMQFPELCRILTLRGAKIVLCPTWGWEEIYAGSRAYENGIYVAGAMAVPYDGTLQGIRSPSSVIAPDGTVVVSGSSGKVEIVSCDIDLSREWEIRKIRMEDRRPELYKEIT
jgi:predicted amidohydrolase